MSVGPVPVNRTNRTSRKQEGVFGEKPEAPSCFWKRAGTVGKKVCLSGKDCGYLCKTEKPAICLYIQ